MDVGVIAPYLSRILLDVEESVPEALTVLADKFPPENPDKMRRPITVESPFVLTICVLAGAVQRTETAAVCPADGDATEAV